MRTWQLWIGVALLGLFGVFAGLMRWYLQGRFEQNDAFIGQLTGASQHPEAAPPAPVEFVEVPLSEGDWPGWRGVRRDGQALPFPRVTSWPARGPEPVWALEVGDGWGACAVVAGRVYSHARQGSDEVIRCLALDTGKEIWKQSYPTAGGYEHATGPCSSPCVADGRLYTVSQDGLVQCRDIDSGSLVWEKDLRTAYNATPPKWSVAFSPLVEGDRLLLNPGAAGASVVAVDRRDGKELWRWGDEQAGYSSPLVATVAGQRVVFMFTGYSLAGLALEDGRELFRHPWATDFQVNASTPLVFQTRQGERVRDYVFITSGYGMGCALLYLRPQQDGTFAPEVVYRGDRFSSHFGSPVRIGDHAYGFHESQLVAMNLRTGEVRWKQSGYKKGSVCALGDELVVVGEEGKLAIGPATPDEPFKPTLAGRFSRETCWTMPVVAQGRLLVKDRTTLFCFDLRR